MSTPQHTFADCDRDLVRIERALHGEEPVLLLVALADHDRLVGRAVKLLAHLHFDERALLLDHDDQIEPLGEVLQLFARERPWARDLEDLDAEIVALDLIKAELVERLAHVEITLADRDDADFRIAPARDDHAVELVRLDEGEHGVALVVVQARFHVENAVDQANVEPAGRHAEFLAVDLETVRRDHDLHAVERAVDHGRRLHRLVHALERRPRAAVARHRPAVERIVDDLLHARGVQDRDHHVDEMEFGLVRGGGGFRRVVVAHQGEHAAILR